MRAEKNVRKQQREALLFHIHRLEKLVFPPHNRALPNAEHSCAGHFFSLFLDARAFYYSLLLVSFAKYLQ